MDAFAWLRRLPGEDARELDALLRERVRLLAPLSSLIILFNLLDWSFYPELALRWLGYRVAAVLLLLLVVQPLSRRLSQGAAFAELVAFVVGTSACFAVMVFESGGFRSGYSIVFFLLCWAFSVIVPLDARRAAVLASSILSPYVVVGVLRGGAPVSLVVSHLVILASALLFTVLGSHLASALFLRQRRAERQARRLIGLLEETSRRDPLTGTFNRRALAERIEVELHRLAREGSGFCLMIADLDHFKKVNDRFGHSAGDLVLVRFSRIVQSVLRSQDGLFRLGGEEFAVLLTGADLFDARSAAERIRRVVEGMRVELAGDRVEVTASIGVAQARSEDQIGSLLGRADAALYRAKDAGRNRVACYREELGTRSPRVLEELL
jgi:diguanylate cyclase (GGDEF)-like protein